MADREIIQGYEERNRTRRATQELRAQARAAEKERRERTDQKLGLRELARKINPDIYIPYRRILEQDGYLTEETVRKVVARKTQIESRMATLAEELIQIQRVRVKFPQKFEVKP